MRELNFILYNANSIVTNVITEDFWFMKTSNKLILFLVQLQEHLGTTFKIVIENFYILTVDEIKQKVLNQHFLDENHKKFVKDIDVCLIDKA